jgi:hypothetical protein
MPSELASASRLRGTGQRALSWREHRRRHSGAPRLTWIKSAQLRANFCDFPSFLKKLSPFSEFARVDSLTHSNLIIPATPGHPVRKIYE